jgi:tetratricopeptide (TPR) repeat protein
MHHDDEALMCYDALLAANPFYEPAWRNKGHLLNAMGIPEEARICFEMADMINPHIGGGAHPKKAGRAGKKAAPKRSPAEEAKEPDVLEEEEKDEED